MSKYEWHRDEDREDGTWSHRLYVADGEHASLQAERLYSPGDRALCRPTTGWELNVSGSEGRGFGGFIFDTLKQAQSFAASPLFAEYVRWVKGNATLGDWEEARSTAIAGNEVHDYRGRVDIEKSLARYADDWRRYVETWKKETVG